VTPVPLAVTVTGKRPARYLDAALAKAKDWGLPFVHRPENKALELMMGCEALAFLVLGGEGWVLHDAHGTFRFTPGMGRVRVKRLQYGLQPDDVLLRLCELRPGDRVLDGTLGLAADSLVCAHVVGPTGQVTGVEGSFVLSALVSEGLKALGSQIVVRHGKTREVLQSMPNGSVECVLLDPMFDRPKKSTPSFDVLRRYAVNEPLELDTLREAQRVARRWVVVKGARFANSFLRLGLQAVTVQHKGPLVWARLPGI
jgi:16S rRNA (guanine1516-N2)-methyltransferase